ncbi:MAG: alpha/beta fold hydrolase [Vicinamibacterales bacterium]
MQLPTMTAIVHPAVGAPPEATVLAIEGGPLECASWTGWRDAPAVLLLHEGLGAVSTWRDVPGRLRTATRRRIIAYSRAGYGRSAPAALPRPVSFMHDEAADVLPRVLDALALPRVTLLGHSDGASIALLYAAAHPERVEALVLEAPHVFVEDLSVASIARMREIYAATDLRDRLARHHGANVDVAFRGWNDVWLDPAFRAWNIEACLPAVRCPVLILQGTDDEYGTLRQVEAIERQAGGPVEVHVLDRCGHAPHRDRADVFYALVARFLGRDYTEG